MITSSCDDSDSLIYDAMTIYPEEVRSDNPIENSNLQQLFVPNTIIGENNRTEESNSTESSNGGGEDNAGSRTSKWQRKFSELVEFKRKHGHFSVSKKSNKALHCWVSKQRSNYKLRENNHYTALSLERVQALDSIGFVWSVQPRNRWSKKFKELTEYRHKHGNCNVREENTELHEFVKTQKYQYNQFKKNKRSTLTPERISALESIGFEWSIDTTKRWHDMFARLKEYKKKNGHCCVPAKEGTLGTWISYQRHQFKLLQENKRSAMTSEKIRLLESINFCWFIYPKDRFS